MSIVERIWWGEDAAASIARTALSPLALAYRGVVAARGWMYDRGMFAAHETAVPAISIGNATVGGTGKTPIAAWVAQKLVERGLHPAIVLRGYGEDEPLVHRALNPAVPVIVSPDRVAGAVRARDEGCDIVVLDDAMQHRRARRVADLALVSADRWEPRARLLPSGPWREPASALRRASAIVVTRKAAGEAEAARVVEWLSIVAPGVPTVLAWLVPDALHAVGGEQERDRASLSGQRVLAIAAVGDPRAFARQLESLGARVELRAFGDHHAFTEREARALAAVAEGMDSVVCTLKDAVKLGLLWPRAARPLWYVSQRVRVELGADALDRVLTLVATRALAARADSPSGDRRPLPANTSSHAH